MRRPFLWFLLALLTVAATASAGLARDLVLIRTGADHGPGLADGGYTLIAPVPDGFLALADAADRARLEAAGFDVRFVGLDDPAREIVVHYDAPAGHRRTELPDGAEVLLAVDGYRIVRLPVAAEHALSGLPDIQRVGRRALRFGQRAWTEPATREDPDPVIAAIVAAVEQSYLETTVQTLQDFGTRHSERAEGLQASLWIRDEFLSYGYTDVTLHDYNGWNDNVVCVKPGAAHPDKYVVVGGHYDSTTSNPADAPGADDNATGTACVMACAKHFAGIEFEYTIVFIAFSGEEQGLYGSDAWASEAAAAGLDVVGAVVLDMLGYRALGDAADIDIVFNTPSQPLRALVDDAITHYVPTHVAVDGSLPFGASSDHASFWGSGYRAILFFEDSGNYSPYIHTSNDRVGTSVNDFPFMLQNVRTALATTAMLARPFTIAIGHDALAHQAGSGPFAIVASVVGAGTVDPASVVLHHRVDGGAFVETTLLPTGDPDEYAADIPAVGNGRLVEYYLTAADTEGRTAASPDGAPAALHEFRTGVEVVFADDGETDQGWTFGAPGDNATTGLWIRADPVGTDYQPEDDHTPAPGHICFVTGNGPVGGGNGEQDVDGGQTTLLSPLFDLTDASWAEVSYWRYVVDQTSYDDDFFVDVSDDGGATWQSLEIVDNTDIPWVHARFTLPIAGLELTDQMRLRFIAQDINDPSLVEGLIDDVVVSAIRGATAVEGEVPSPAAALTAQPNPFNPRTVITFALPREGVAELRILDARGREVARPLAGLRPAGAGEVHWSARGLASGVYLAQLRLDGEELATTKLTLVR